MNNKRRNIIILISILLVIILIFPVKEPKRAYSTVLYSYDNQLLGAKIASDGQWRFPELDSVPYKFEKSIILFEDQYFYKHPGINPFSLLRALQQNIKAKRIVSGGSTLTMQLVRMNYNNPARTIWQKMKEIIIALKLDLKYSKKEIIVKYASNAPFGGNVVGLEAAAWRYYGRKPHQLSWSESATLAVLPNSPALIRPGRNMDQLLQKRNFLLNKLYKNQVIDSITYELSLLERLPGKPFAIPQEAPHLLERLTLSNSGEKLLSCIDYQLQKNINRITVQHQKKLAANEIYNMAVIVVKMETGEVIGYIGNTDINNSNEHGSDVDIITAPRSSGSILKPLLYSIMLDNGEILPESLIADIPTQMKGYSPKNYDLNYDGAVPASKALSRSLNVPAVHMLQDFGVNRFLDYLQKMNFSHMSFSAEHYGLSLILGGAEVSLWDLAGTYTSYGRILNHYATNSSMYRKADFHAPVLLKKDINPIKNNEFQQNKDINGAASIWLTFEALLKVNRPENELGWESFYSSKKIAWKTGTSFGFRDAWAIGFNKEFLVGVWVGNADGEGRPGIVGVLAAAPVLFEIFDLLPGNEWFTKPYDDLVKVPVCVESGHRASFLCPNTDSLEIPESGLKTEPCPYHMLIHLDKSERYRVNSKCAKPLDMVHKSWFVLPPAWEWYYKRKNPLYKTLPPFRTDCNEINTIPLMQFVYPNSETNIYIPRDIDGNIQKVVFEVAHRYPEKKVFWHIDNEFIGQTFDMHQMEIFANEGEHIITAVDEDGNSIKRKVFFVSRY